MRLRLVLASMILGFCLSAFGAPIAPSTQPTRPAGPAGGLTRQKAIQFLAACEREWLNQAVFYRTRAWKYESLDKINDSNLFLNAFKLTAITNQRQVDESLYDSRENPAGEWRRLREIVVFDGKRRTEWIDYENEFSRREGGRHLMLMNPADIYAFYGCVDGRPLSEMIAKADEFYWSPDVETIGGDQCVKANCIIRSSEGGADQTTRFELALAIEGALFPKQILRFVDRGDGEKRAAAWEALEVDKDLESRIWRVKSGRYFSLGTQSVYQVDVLSRREIKPVQDSEQYFSIDFPSEAMASTKPTIQPAKPRKIQREVSFFPKMMNIHVADLEERLNKSYKNGVVVAWGREVSMPRINNKGSKSE